MKRFLSAIRYALSAIGYEPLTSLLRTSANRKGDVHTHSSYLIADSGYLVKKAQFVTALGMTLALSGCNDMDRQPKFKPLDPSPFFSDGRSARPPVADTVARGDLRLDDHLYTGKVKGEDAKTFPFPITADVLARGRERYDIFCSACHGRVGDGQGMIVKRGFPAPPSYHTNRLRKAPVGHYFDVITNGYGRMYSYAERIPVTDRWAIIAYIRALQLSQDASFSDLPNEEKAELVKVR